MAAIDHTRRSGAFEAASRALDSAIDAAIAGSPTHASGTTFVPADLAHTPALRRYRIEGPVAIVDGEGNEVRLARGDNRVVLTVLILAGAAIVAWALRKGARLPA